MLPFGPTFLSLKVRLEDRILKQESEGGLDRLGGEKMKLDQEQRVLIEKLFLEMINPLSAYAKKVLHNHLLAEEAVQETFRIACTRANKLLSSSNSKGWLFITLKNVIKNTIRNFTHVNSKLFFSINLDEDLLIGHIDTLKVDFLYSDLVNIEDYKLIKKIALDKYTVVETAHELGISVETCKKRVQRAKKRLKKYLQVDLN
ncbi:sigma-70 family RNA polymerase sigma factor [Paenibacillus sp. FSL R7-0204]|uniref:RNA polymerase sigma factor n=1 Tax=Paenibacillus sp. FSL R7-0204 TaxID=2921675 RepID=UPI0030F77A39